MCRVITATHCFLALLIFHFSLFSCSERNPFKPFCFSQLVSFYSCIWAHSMAAVKRACEIRWYYFFVLHFDLFLQGKNEVRSPQNQPPLGGWSSDAQRKNGIKLTGCSWSRNHKEYFCSFSIKRDIIWAQLRASIK